MTVRNAVENQMQHQMVLSYIFVQLFYIYLSLLYETLMMVTAVAETYW
jgi:hypothetical protein